MNDKNTIIISENAKISAAVSAYLQAEHTAKAFEAKAKEARAELLEMLGADGKSNNNFVVESKGGTEFCVTYNAKIVGYDCSVIADEISALKERIAELEAAHGVKGFKCYTMRERKSKDK